MEIGNNLRDSLNDNEIINSNNLFNTFDINKHESDEKYVLNNSYDSEIFFKMKYIIKIL